MPRDSSLGTMFYTLTFGLLEVHVDSELLHLWPLEGSQCVHYIFEDVLGGFCLVCWGGNRNTTHGSDEVRQLYRACPFLLLLLVQVVCESTISPCGSGGGESNAFSPFGCFCSFCSGCES